MNKSSITILKALRKMYKKVVKGKPLSKPACEQDPNVVSKIIYDKLMIEEPCMIGRFGATELSAVVNYLGVRKDNRSKLDYITGKSQPYWWQSSILTQLQKWSGFFPATEKNVERFCEMMLQDMLEVDILGSWLSNETFFSKELSQVEAVWLDFLMPFFSTTPWTKALQGKKVLVVHPFSRSIENQYLRRHLLFSDLNVLPEFDLQTIAAVQSLGGVNSSFSNWFDALDSMKAQIEETDFDVCLIGCGAYGFPLAAHVKRIGRKAVHLGGSLQLLFGIRGKRWEDPNLNSGYSFASYMNEFWIRPGEEEKPETANEVEGGCYW